MGDKARGDKAVSKGLGAMGDKEKVDKLLDFRRTSIPIEIVFIQRFSINH